MESTEQKRVWHSGPPPHVGWWQASGSRNPQLWRWWNGTNWSLPVMKDYCDEWLQEAVKSPTVLMNILWNDYWPADARVPRLAPEDFQIGARWVCVNRIWSWEFPGLEYQVVKVNAHFITLESYRSVIVEKLECLPSKYHVPRRCVGPQTRWDFPKPKGCNHG